MDKNKFNADGKCKVCGKDYGQHYDDDCPTDKPSRTEMLEAQVKLCESIIKDLREQNNQLVEAFEELLDEFEHWAGMYEGGSVDRVRELARNAIENSKAKNEAQNER